MKPESPVIPGSDPETEVVWAKDQKEYISLPSLRRPDGIILTRWALAETELAGLINGGDLIVWQWSTEHPQRQRIDVLTPDDARAMFASETIAPTERGFLSTAANLGYYRFSFTDEQRALLDSEGHIFLWIWTAGYLHPVMPEVVTKQGDDPYLTTNSENLESANLITEVPQ